MGARGLVLLVLMAAFLSYGIKEADCECSDVKALASRLDSLLAEFDREVPPAAHVLVQLSLDVHHATIVEDSSTLRLLADLHMSWQDERISWNASEWGCEWALVDGERLWTPDVALANAGGTGAGEQPLSARLNASGAAAFTRRLDVSIPIAMSLLDWPADVQTGTFMFASRSHSVDEIDLKVIHNKNSRLKVFESGAWEVESLSGDVVSEPHVAGARALAAWRLTLRRRAPATRHAARSVLAAELMLLAAAALLPPETRAPLAAAAAFVSAVWSSVAVWRLEGGAQAPRAVVLQGAVCGCAGAAALAAALAARVARLSAPPPAAVRAALAAASRVLTQHVEGGAWLAAARALDALLLAALALVMLVLLALYL